MLMGATIQSYFLETLEEFRDLILLKSTEEALCFIVVLIHRLDLHPILKSNLQLQPCFQIPLFCQSYSLIKEEKLGCLKLALSIEKQVFSVKIKFYFSNNLQNLDTYLGASV
jgi:hypothetical protein